MLPITEEFSSVGRKESVIMRSSPSSIASFASLEKGSLPGNVSLPAKGILFRILRIKKHKEENS